MPKRNGYSSRAGKVVIASFLALSTVTGSMLVPAHSYANTVTTTRTVSLDNYKVSMANQIRTSDTRELSASEQEKFIELIYAATSITEINDIVNTAKRALNYRAQRNSARTTIDTLVYLNEAEKQHFLYEVLTAEDPEAINQVVNNAIASNVIRTKEHAQEFINKLTSLTDDQRVEYTNQVALDSTNTVSAIYDIATEAAELSVKQSGLSPADIKEITASIDANISIIDSLGSIAGDSFFENLFDIISVANPISGYNRNDSDPEDIVPEDGSIYSRMPTWSLLLIGLSGAALLAGTIANLMSLPR